MGFNELIKQALMQMYQSSLNDTEELERLDRRVMTALRKEREGDEKGGACGNSQSGSVG